MSVMLGDRAVSVVVKHINDQHIASSKKKVKKVQRLSSLRMSTVCFSHLQASVDVISQSSWSA